MIIKDPYGFIYITTNILNGKRYIGQKKFRTNWEYYKGSGKLLKQAIKKYGTKNFVRDIVDIAYSKEELDSLEIEWIHNYSATNDSKFYNIASGGEGFCGENNTMFEKNKVKVVCLEDKKYFNSMSDASYYYNIKPHKVKSTFDKKKIYYINKGDYKTIIFRVVKGKYEKYENDKSIKFCCNCGRIINLKTKNKRSNTYFDRKYCEKCSNEINKVKNKQRRSLKRK